MLVLGLALSTAGLFVAGVVQPDGPAAALTPTTARYYRGVFGAPGPGLVVLAHHVVALPNEAAWVLVPAMGACDAVRGSADLEFLCYARFPRSADAVIAPLAGGAVDPGAFRGVPAGYLAFLLVPGLATVLGGRWVARRIDRSGRDAVVVGASAGAVFGALVLVTSVLGSLTLSYGAALGEEAGGGSLWIGPDPILGTALALGWGLLGGSLGAVSAGWGPRLTPSTRPSTPR